MPERVRLRQEGAVGVAVHQHAIEAQGGADVVDVVRRGGRAVGVEARTELVGTRGHPDRVVGQAPLQLGTVDRLGRAGSPGLDQQQLPAPEQTGEGVDVAGGAGDRAVPRVRPRSPR